MSTLSSGTTLTTAIKFTSDTTGSIVFQSNGTTEAMRIDTSQNVGIGDSAPSSLGKLVIAGATQKAYFSTNSTYGAPALLSLATQDLYLNPTQQSDRRVGIGGNGYAFSAMLMVRPASGQAPFSVENSAASASYFYINSTGNVGIGTTSPATRLQIGNYGSTEELTLAMSANAEGRINFYDTNNTEGAVIRVVGGGAGAKMHFTNRYDTDSDKVTFDLVNGRVGIGTTSPSENLDIQSSGDLKARIYTTGSTVSTHAGLTLKTGSYEYIIQNFTTTAGSAGALRFYDITAGAERMRITAAGNVGIGTTSPGARLDIAGGTAADLNTPAVFIENQKFLVFRRSSGSWGMGLFTDSSDNSSIISYGYLAFANGSSATESMRIDTSGNVGIGVTPNSWTSGWTALQFGSYGNLSALSNQINLSSNIYYSGSSWYYKNTNPATNFYQQNGGFGWQSAASGTAGTSPSLTTYMWLSAAGNLGIGTTSPGARLDVFASRTSSTNATALILSDGVTGAQTDGVYKSIRSQSNGSSSVSEIRFIESDGSNNNTAIGFATQAVAGGLTERMRIDQKGNLGIGITPTNSTNYTTLEISNATNGAIFNLCNGATNKGQVFYDSGGIGVNTLGTARNIRWKAGAISGSTDAHMTLNTSGNLGIGVTSPACILDISGSAGGQIKFPATQNASSDANTLDDYEEGSWTPRIGTTTVLRGAGSANIGRYIKIGRQVTLTATVSWTAGSDPTTGTKTITGIPFPHVSTTDLRAAGTVGAIASGSITFASGFQGGPVLVIDPSATFIYFIQTATSGDGYAHDPTINSTGTLYGITITYFTDS